MSSAVVLTLAGIALYFGASLTIAIIGGRRAAPNSNDFLNASGKFPTWVASLSFLACNCSALEVLGLSGIAAHYGVQAFHFYWIGAIPALIFVSFVILPAYVRSEVRSVPEYLGRRFGSGPRLFNACAVLISTAVYAGVSVYGLAEVMHVAAGWPFSLGIATFVPIALGYVLIGGIRGTVYNEVFQFLFMFVGLVPLLYFTRNLRVVKASATGQYWNLWRDTPLYSQSHPLDRVGVIVGLGMIISFAYWCTDFALVQRALTARSLESAQRVPLIAGLGKLVFSFVIVVPVVLMIGANKLTNSLRAGALDETSPLMILSLYGPKLIFLGVAGLAAGLLSSLASNVSAFSAVWTTEIYRLFLSPHESERHYIRVGRLAMFICVGVSVAAAFATRSFENLSGFVLLTFSLLVVPFFAVVLTGVLSNRGTERSVCLGVLAGIVAGGALRLSFARHWSAVGSELTASFYTAIVSFFVTLVACNVPFSRCLGVRTILPSRSFSQLGAYAMPSRIIWLLGGMLGGLCLLLNVICW